ncbi:thermonuclease family protein [Rivularia sp. UHCC 0363]|uniref:thermonuclease family protein n=1 Tax=Rivularia sp. UHCC 0363 TaxID=3110244 RepID=UPI002B214982|nr:thermonuclease family protein [Rivularia sp. UHCC 0363]MEA5595701.1 thermonuclease family protein [Rivularia sp. UHCC 0363]
MKKLTKNFINAGLFVGVGGVFLILLLSGKQQGQTANSSKVAPISERWTVVKVSDGDTITVRQTNKQMKIRFCGIDSPEKAMPLGNNATVYLQKLIQEAGNQVMVSQVERDRYGRTVAEVFTLLPDGSEKFLNEEMVRSGFAYHYARYSNSCPNKIAIENAEAIARQQKVGVWSGNYQKPWDYRKKGK